MPRFFKEFFETAPFIDGEDARHILRSLRMTVGEKITVSDTKVTDFDCVISSCSADRVELEILNKKKNDTEPTVFVTIYLCLTKGDKMDMAVRQSVELGASKIVPVISTNCVSRPDEKSLKKKQERWQKIADEAAGQSGRGILPLVGKTLSLKQVCKEITKDDLCVFCYELAKEQLSKFEENIKNISVIIGPEGGFCVAEAEMLHTAGAKVISLGKRILRAETAPVAALSAVMIHSGNM